MNPNGTRLRELPSVDLVARTLLAAETSSPTRAAAPSPPTPAAATRDAATHASATRAARQALEELRLALVLEPQAAPSRAELLDRAVGAARRILARRTGPSLRPLINATGIVLHTNLGRARLAPEAARAAAQAGGPVNLELSLTDGSRLSRQSHTRELLMALTGAEDALVVNNNAAAVWLALRNLARGRRVVISRGELVEIGESFRLPDIMAEAGVDLVEVGSTNRTTLEDYRLALGGHPETRRRGSAAEGATAEAPAAIVLVHPSNYRVIGYASRPPRREIVALARAAGVPVLEDLGSGALIDLGPWGLPGEPVPRQALGEGVDLVTFSGDKLLGGPQAGILAGRRDLVGAARNDPVLRCLRPDKAALAALEATLRLYGEGPAPDPARALAAVPVLRALTEPAEVVRRRAARALRLTRTHLRAAEPLPAEIRLLASTTEAGGGSLPASELPTWTLCVAATALSPDDLWRKLAASDPPVVGRRHGDALLLDFRSVTDEEVPALARILAAALIAEGGA